MKTSIQLAGTFVTAIVLTFTACRKDESSPQPSSANQTTEDASDNPDAVNSTALFTPGYIYVESNATDANAVLVYAQQSDGSLKLQSVAKTGGAGTGMSLGSQGAVVLDELHMWLYAVNAGDNTISAFRVVRDGNLSLAGKVSSYGVTPVSLTTFRNMLYVVNAGSDNIQGFFTGADGPTISANMIPIAGSNRQLSATGSGPAQISFSPNGAYLYVTEKKTNKISCFKVDEKGEAWPGFINPSLGKSPFGFVFTYQDAMVVANASAEPDAGSVTPYIGANTGTLLAASNPVANKQTASSWIATTSFGRFVYVTNTQSNSISVYSVGLYGRLALLFPGISGGFAPTDIVIDASNQHVYIISSTDHTIKQYIRRADGYLTNMIPDGGGVIGLPSEASGMATFTPGLISNTRK